MKLELKHITPYLESGVMVHCSNGTNYRGENNITATELDSKALEGWGIENIKPILKPLSDLHYDKDEGLLIFEYCDTEGYINCYLKDKLTQRADFFKLDGAYYKATEMPWDFIQYLISKHYDVFGLIPKDLAIDINIK